jgi:phytoene synthase
MSSALDNAKQALAQKGRTFYWASFLLGAKHADRATRLYGVCRHIDDLADEAQSVQLAKLALKQVAVDFRAGFSNDPIIQDGLDLAAECPFETVILASLVTGVRSDLELVYLNDESSLIRYCYQVAGTVGLMMSKALDTHDPKAYPHAIDLGIAMQLTNICRDVQADAILGRCYIPKSLIGTIDLASLANPSLASQALIKPAIDHLLKLADAYYASGEEGLAYLPLGARSGILLASRIYREIGVRLALRHYDYWSSRVVVSTMIKLKISISTLATMLFSLRFWRPSRTHSASLHHPIRDFLGANVG